VAGFLLKCPERADRIITGQITGAVPYRGQNSASATSSGGTASQHATSSPCAPIIREQSVMKRVPPGA